MEKQEVLEYMNIILQDELDWDNQERAEAIREVIKVYKQESVLGKIKAEIEQEYLAEGHLSDYWYGIDKCLQIIDKYKVESEKI